MKVLKYILELVLDPLGMIHWWLICLSDVIDPFLEHHRGLEQHLQRQTFNRINERADNYNAPQDDDLAYNEWIHSQGYNSADELINEQIKAFNNDTENNTNYGRMFANWGL